MTTPLPQAPEVYEKQQFQQALATIEQRLRDLEAAGQMSWTVITKEADQTITSDDSLGDDDELSFTVEAQKTYRFRFVIFYDTATAADFKFDVNGPASPTLVQILTMTVAPGATAFGNIAIKTAFAFTAVAITETSGTNGMIVIEGIVQNGANTGGVSFRWAQNTSNGGNTTVRAGSYVQYGKA